MEEHAWGVVKHFSSRHEILLFTASGNGHSKSGLSVAVINGLTGRLESDVELLRRHRVDAWLAMSAGSASYAPFLSSPFFAYVHGNDFISPWAPQVPSWLTRFEAFSWRLAARAGAEWRRQKIGAGLGQAKLIFANSRYTRDRCRSIFSLNLDKMVVVAPGIDDSCFATPLTRTPKQQFDQLNILTVCRLSAHARRKNVEAVIEAVAMLEGRLNIQCVIVGDGNDKDRLQRMAEGLGVASKVRFTGEVSREAKDQLYRWADLFVLPVKPLDGDVEGFGMAYIEANAHGLPVIAVDCGGVAEAVSPKTGILLQNSSASAVAQAISGFCLQPAIFQSDVIRGAAEVFSAEVTCRKLMEHIEARSKDTLAGP
jgi:phosphatidyl-myo-inositol dimannoside synthase